MSTILYHPVHGLGASIRGFIFSPFLSGPLLLASIYAPDTLRRIATEVTSKLPDNYALLSGFNVPAVIKWLSVLFGLSVIRWLNSTLNTLAANSWRLTAGKGWNWPNEIAVVTGGSSGIGKLIVEKLVALGVRVAVLDVQDMPKSMESNTNIRFFECDVTSSEAVMRTAEAIRAEMGHPSILINNAGITKPTPILQMTESFLRKIFGVNTMSHWFTTQQFLPHMIEVNKGHIITVASLASFVALPTGADYSATKAAALAFHESLTCEIKHCYKATNILTTVVHPNFVRTPLIEDFADHLERSGVRMLTSDQVASPIVAQITSRRGGQLIIPQSTSIITGIRGWPTWLQELLRDKLGRSSLKK